MKKAKAVYEFLPLYNRHLFYANDIPAAVKLIKSYIDDKVYDLSLITEMTRAHGFVAPIWDKKDVNVLMALLVYVDDKSDFGTITHEATHVTSFIFDYVGQDLDAINDEAAAYLTGYVAQRFMENIRGAKPSIDAPLKKLKRTK